MNILFVMADQHRFDFLGCMGAAFVNTPNIDHLAGRGMLFTTCVTNSPVCAPARIGLASGMHPANLGSLDNQSYLPARAGTYYQRLRDHGYRVGSVGKLDLAKPDPYNGRLGDRPRNFTWGFTEPHETEGKMHAAGDRPLGPYGFWLQQNDLFERFRDDYHRRRASGWIRDAHHDSVLDFYAYEESYIGRHAVKWLNEVNDDFPWHYFVSFVGPHDPFDPPTEYADLYRDAPMPPPVDDDLAGKPAWVRKRELRLAEGEVAQIRRQYCATIQLIDFWIGEMVSALTERGLLEQTLIIFTSDHGEMLGDHRLYTKSLPYEAAIRVPLVVAGPGVQSGKVSNAVVELIDLNPTICELAGLPPQEGIDAISFAPLLGGKRKAHRSEAVSEIREFRLVRTATHKFIRHASGAVELYDLTVDPNEVNNIAANEPDTVRDLSRRFVDRFTNGGSGGR